MDTIRAELESIKNVLKFQVSELADERKKRHNPTHHYLHEQLIGMGVSAQLARQFIDFLPHNVDEKQGWKYLLNLLSNRLHVGGNDILNQSGVVALVGPTGTGKTTTLAKLAAKYAQKYGADQVAMVTIDTYRIAAFEQLATYGRIIGCSVKKAQSAEELNQLLYQMRNKKLVLIDTAGFSQRDARLIEQLNEYETGLSVNIRKYLVLPAGAQYQVLNQTVKAYHSTEVQGCIFTKLDECYSLGEALSVIIENDLALSYVTDGQRVPEDIKLADSANLTLVAAKLYKKYGLPMLSQEPAANAGGL
jgi:flagellar biosynthesis protein FlhF